MGDPDLARSFLDAGAGERAADGDGGWLTGGRVSGGGASAPHGDPELRELVAERAPPCHRLPGRNLLAIDDGSARTSDDGTLAGDDVRSLLDGERREARHLAPSERSDGDDGRPDGDDLSRGSTADDGRPPDGDDGGPMATTGGLDERRREASTLATTGGPTRRATGGPMATGGPPATTGGPMATTGGPTATTGGPMATTGGPTATTGGPMATTGGPTATTGGPTATTGGSMATTGGPTATTGGPMATTGGPSATTGRSTLATTGGPTATTGGPTATTGGPTATTEARTATTGGPTATTRGYDRRRRPRPRWRRTAWGKGALHACRTCPSAGRAGRSRQGAPSPPP